MKKENGKLIRNKVCRDCEIKYKTFGKLSNYCIFCYSKRRKAILPRRLIKLYPKEELTKIPTIKNLFSDGEFIKEKGLNLMTERR